MRWLSFLASGVPVILLFPAPSLSYLAWFALVPGMVLFTRAATTREAVARGSSSGPVPDRDAVLDGTGDRAGPGAARRGHGLDVVPVRRRGAQAAAAGRGVVAPARRVRGGAAAGLSRSGSAPTRGSAGPWDLYGASQWQHPTVLALAAVGGVWLVSVALVMANVALVVILGALRRMPLTPVAPIGRRPRGRAARAARAAAGVVAFAVVAGAGPLAFALTPPFPAARTDTIALVQPGVVAQPGAAHRRERDAGRPVQRRRQAQRCASRTSSSGARARSPTT